MMFRGWEASAELGFVPGEACLPTRFSHLKELVPVQQAASCLTRERADQLHMLLFAECIAAELGHDE